MEQATGHPSRMHTPIQHKLLNTPVEFKQYKHPRIAHTTPHQPCTKRMPLEPACCPAVMPAAANLLDALLMSRTAATTVRPAASNCVPVHKQWYIYTRSGVHWCRATPVPFAPVQCQSCQWIPPPALHSPVAGLPAWQLQQKLQGCRQRGESPFEGQTQWHQHRALCVVCEKYVYGQNCVLAVVYWFEHYDTKRTCCSSPGKQGFLWNAGDGNNLCYGAEHVWGHGSTWRHSQ